jgi:predicted acyltransferase
MGGMAMVALASCYYVADVRKITWWTPWFIVFGVNSIAVWVGSVVFKQTLEKLKLKTWMFNGLADWFGSYNGSLAFAILYVLFWWVIMSILYRRRVFFKV